MSARMEQLNQISCMLHTLFYFKVVVDPVVAAADVEAAAGNQSSIRWAAAG